MGRGTPPSLTPPLVGGGYYGNQNTIMIDEIDDENVAYHVGYNLGAFLLDERPPELSSDSNYDERENWPES